MTPKEKEIRNNMLIVGFILGCFFGAVGMAIIAKLTLNI